MTYWLLSKNVTLRWYAGSEAGNPAVCSATRAFPADPCHASCHFTPAATTPGMAVTVTSRGSCSRVCVWPSVKADPIRHQMVVKTALDFMAPTRGP